MINSWKLLGHAEVISDATYPQWELGFGANAEGLRKKRKAIGPLKGGMRFIKADY
ncbi:hypothetical protein RBB77_01545 [Tunturibacter psychrotolerans]|uniref:Uncharacterized protein n=1 Tax=Tunturiibacter psychrotolerans TaxID=3069686 RepID=A0AAU7ZRI7_9BACT